MKGLFAGISVMMRSMKSQWFKVLWRFWPGLLCLAVVFILLAWGLEPRPRKIAVLPFTSLLSKYDHAFSPDGKFLATRSTGIISGHGGYYSAITLHDLITQSEVFTENNYIDDFRFDADGNLVYLITQPHFHDKRGRQKQLALWHPGEPKGIVVWEHDDIGSREDERIVKQRGSIVHTYFRLSPDARTLLFATFDKTHVRGEFIDSVTGKARHTFTLLSQNRDGVMLHEVHTVFTSDSKTVIVQTNEIEVHSNVQECYWHWVDVMTGKVLQTMKLPETPISQGFLLATATTPIAQATNSAGEMYFIFVKNKQVQSVKLDEMRLPQVTEKHQPKTITQLKESIGSSENELIAYQWWNLRDVSKDLSEMLRGWAVRDVSSGKLLQTYNEADQDHSQKGNDADQWHLVTLLQGRYLILERFIQDDQGVINRWLKQARSWLGLREEENQALRLMDVGTGANLQQIHIPLSGTSVLLAPDGNSITVLLGNENSIEVRTYDFPLHQPWLLIWTWALGVAAAITLLVEARRWWRRPKSVQAHLVPPETDSAPLTRKVD